MKEKITINGKPVIAMYSSFDGDLWIVTEMRDVRDTRQDDSGFKKDQIAYGFCKSFTGDSGDFREFSLSFLRANKDWAAKVPKANWKYCPEVDGYIASECE